MKTENLTYCIRGLWAALALVISFSCQEKEPVPEPIIPSITISEVSATVSSVSFKVTPKDAVRYTYSVLPEGVSGAVTSVDNGEESVITVDGLESETEYVITALAYSQDNFESEAATYEFVTTAEASLVISSVEPSVTSVVVEFTPSNATGLKYSVYESGAQPSDWVELQTSEKVSETIENLVPETEYVVEAYAYNDEGDGQVVKETFTTLPEPEALSVEMVATASSIYVSFVHNPDKAASYLYMYPTTPDALEYSDIDGFIEHVEANSWFYTSSEESVKIISSGNTPATGYVVYAICQDNEGNLLPETAVSATVTTKTISFLGSSEGATAELKGVNPSSISAEFDIALSDNCVMYYAGMVPVSDADANGGIANYIDANMSGLTLNYVEESDFKVTVSNIVPKKEYYAAVFGVDMDGDITNLSSQKVTTAAVDYDEESTAEITLVESGFSGVTLNLVKNNCQDVRYMFVTKDEASFNSDDYYYEMLFSSFSSVIFPDEQGNFRLDWLMYDTEYVLYTLPVKENGSFGMPGKTEFSTAKYENLGNSTVSIEILDYDRTQEYFVTCKVKVTPDQNCGSYVYYAMSAEEYNNFKNKIEDHICSGGMYTTIDPAVESEFSVDMWGEDYYLVVIPIDKDGKWSAAVVSDRMSYNE